MLDICISITGGLLALISGVSGVVMALYPPDTDAKKKGYIATFMACGILGIAFVAWQGVRSINAHDREQKLVMGDVNLPPLVDFLFLSDRWIVVVSNESGASAYAVDIDLSEVTPHPFDRPLTFLYPEVNSHSAPIVATAIPPPDGDLCTFTALIRTRIGNYSEQIVLRHLANGRWSRALRVMNDSGLITHQEHPDFPRNSTGQIDW
jgi:hypothetical protein